VENTEESSFDTGDLVLLISDNDDQAGKWFKGEAVCMDCATQCF
jgi:hypothetical protein